MLCLNLWGLKCLISGEYYIYQSYQILYFVPGSALNCTLLSFNCVIFIILLLLLSLDTSIIM